MEHHEDDGGWASVPKNSDRKRNKRQENMSQHNDDVLPWISEIPPCHNNTQFRPFMLLLCGIPGAGKSTFAKSLQQAMPYKFVRINQDDLGNRKRCEELARAALSNGQCPVIDRCNFDNEQREKFVAIAGEFNVPVDCVVLEIETLATVDECIQRCQKRKDHPTIKPSEARGVVIGMAQQMKPPPPTRNREGIRHVWYVPDRNIFNDTIVGYLNRLE